MYQVIEATINGACLLASKVKFQIVSAYVSKRVDLFLQAILVSAIKFIKFIVLNIYYFALLSGSSLS